MKVFIKISFLVFVLLAATIIFSTSSTAYAATFVQDSFTGTGGTLLENHTGETGATWAKNPAALTGSMALTSTGALRDNTSVQNDSYYYASGTPASADYSVQADFTLQAVPTGTTPNFGVQGREDPTAETFYWALYNYSSTKWELYKRVNGSATLLNNSAVVALSTGRIYTLNLTMVGSAITFSVDGAVVASATDTSITAAGKAGVGMYSSNAEDGDGVYLDDFIANDTSAPTAYSLKGPSAGTVNGTSSGFTVTPNGPYTGTVTITPSGGGLSTPIVLTFSNSMLPQTFSITPTIAGAITLTPTNSGTLPNPSTLTYTAASLVLISDDSFNRADTALGAAGSTNIGNGWVDVHGNVWKITSNRLVGTPYINSFITSQLVRPISESAQDVREVVTTPAGGLNAGNQAIAAVLRYNAAAGIQYLFKVDTGTVGANIYTINTPGGATTTLDSFTSFTINPSDQYSLDVSAIGVSPTTLSYTLTDITTSTQVFSRTITSSLKPTLQGSGQMGVITQGSSNGTTPDIQFSDIKIYKLASLALTGPSAGTTGTASTNFTVTPNSAYTGTITPSDGGAGGTFSPSSISFSNSSTPQTFTYTPAATGTKTISISSSPTIINPTSLMYLSTSPSSFIAPNDSNIFYSPENWFFSGSSFARSSTPGAYFKTGFTGTTLQLNVDTSAMTSIYPKIAYTIDGGTIQDITLTSASLYNLTPTPLVSGNHQLALYIDGIGFTDRWTTPIDQLKFVGLTVDVGATTVTPTLAAKRLVVYGDSITEGASQLAATDTPTNAQWTTSWDKLLGDDLNAEVGAIGYQAEGYEQTGQGNVPGLTSAWNLLKSTVSRTFTPEPDYAMILHGQNGTTTQNDVTTMITNLRSIYPHAIIFIGVPFSQVAKSTITTAFNSQSDSRAFLVDLGTTGSSTVTANTFDGTHPNVTGHSLLAGQLNTIIAADINSLAVGFTGPSSGTVNSNSTNFTVTPAVAFTGTITATPSGGGLSTPIVLTFSNSQSPQTFIITPTTPGTVTVTLSNSGHLTNSTLTYVSNAVVSSGGGGAAVGGVSGGSGTPPDCSGTIAYSPHTGIRCANYTGAEIPITTAYVSTNPSSTTTHAIFTRNLYYGVGKNIQIQLLQQYLNAHGFTVAVIGNGSVGHETTYFGPATKAALSRFQKAYGIIPSNGYFGPITRGYINAH
jgi:lysophospholipase L1-like esterase